MTAYALQTPFPQFYDVDGAPLANGKLYFGVANQNPETTPVTVYWDQAKTTPAAQPIRTVNGQPARNGTPAQVYIDGDFSITVRDRNGRMVQTSPNSSEFSVTSAVDNLNTDLANTSIATKGDYLLGVKKTASNATATTQHEVNERAYSVFDRFSAAEIADVLTNAGTLDVGPAIRQALAWGIPLRFPRGTYVVDYDPASAFNDGGTTRYSYSLKIPSNAVLIFEDGAVIKQKAGAQKWTRTVSFEGADNVRVFGELNVDANVANVGAATNEHMHGVFIFDTTNTYIERIRSENARGDNVFIGGTDEATYGHNVTIGSIRAKKAGRKNLTLHYCDALHIGIADLDNSTGGAAIYSGGVADNTDKHSLDVEPDAFTGSRRFEQWIGRLRTYGLGNDFTAGTTPTHGDNWILNIGVAECVQSGSSATVPAWEQNAITINVDSLSITGCAGIDGAVRINYAARLNAGSVTISGATATSSGFMVVSATTGGDDNRPTFNIDQLKLSNTVGGGLQGKSILGHANTFEALRCAGPGLEVGDNVTSARYQGSLYIGEFFSRDTGTPTTGYVVSLTTFSIGGFNLTIKKAIQYDTRGTKAAGFITVGAGNAAGLTLSEYISPENLTAVNWASTDKYYRLVGSKSGTSLAPGVFVCQGTPEGMITAPIGSTAHRLDGGAGTSFYVKQSGTANTGWVGK